MRIRNAFCLCAFVLGLTPPMVRSQAAAELRDRPHDAQGWPSQAVRAGHGMVATDEELGSEAGGENLKRGGKGVDGAVAPAFPLAGGGAPARHIRGGWFIFCSLPHWPTTF